MIGHLTRTPWRHVGCLAALAVTACGSQQPPLRGSSPTPAGTQRPADFVPGSPAVGQRHAGLRVGRWRVDVEVVGPRDAGPMRFDAGPLHGAGRHGVKHALLFANTGRRTVAFGDTRRSRLLGRGGREPLAADGGCGYAFEPGERLPLVANACLRNLDTFTVAPGRTTSREVSLTWELPGGGQLTAGRYVFRRLVRFAPGTTAPDAGDAPDRVVRIIYTVRRGPMRREGRGAG